ncbi:MAG: universal stress protein [Pseudomonadota bacterium]
MTAPRRVLAVLRAGGGDGALQAAEVLAERHGATLEAIGCIEPPHDLDVVARLAGRPAADMLAAHRDREARTMREQIDATVAGRDVPLRVVVGKPFVEIVRHVLDTGCDFVVKGAEPLSGLRRILFASTDQHLLRKCPCPVWLLTEGAEIRPRRVIAAVDVDNWDAAEPETLHDLNLRVIASARAVAARAEAEVVVLHAWQAEAEGLVWAFSSGRGARLSSDVYVNEVLGARRREMDRLIREAGSEGVRLVPRLTRGAPERVIEEECRTLGAALVVLGTVARTGLHGVIIGNTAENIINSLEHPIVALKPNGFVSPLAPG